MKNLKFVILFFGLLMFSCVNDSASSSNNTETQTFESIDGTYSYEETWGFLFYRVRHHATMKIIPYFRCSST